ncbi:MAG: hypothetical protein MJ072_04755, partial [Clostridia bacterium]|nr:hypothetical protein [Clostridia bacterium]
QDADGRIPINIQPEDSVFTDKYRFELKQAELRKLPDDARTFPKNGFVNGEQPILETTGKEYTRDDEYKLLFQREICEKGINGKTDSSLTDFLAQNKGSIFNVKFGRDSKEYKALSKFLEEFQDRLAGKKDAFPKQRQNDPKMIKQDYEYLKELFENYIKHKREQLLNDKKTSFKLNSTDDKRYKFALKMYDILKQVAEFRPLNLESKCERTYGIKIIGKIVNNTADGGFGKNIVNEESKFVLNDKGKNIVNEESKLPLNDGMTEIDTDLLQSKLGDYFKTAEKNQMSETPAVQTVETEKQINGEDLDSKGV